MNKQELTEKIALSVAGSAFLGNIQKRIHSKNDSGYSWEGIAKEIIAFSEALTSELIKNQEDAKTPSFHVGQPVFSVYDNDMKGVVIAVENNKYYVEWGGQSNYKAGYYSASELTGERSWEWRASQIDEF